MPKDYHLNKEEFVFRETKEKKSTGLNSDGSFRLFLRYNIFPNNPALFEINKERIPIDNQSFNIDEIIALRSRLGIDFSQNDYYVGGIFAHFF